MLFMVACLVCWLLGPGYSSYVRWARWTGTVFHPAVRELQGLLLPWAPPLLEGAWAYGAGLLSSFWLVGGALGTLYGLRFDAAPAAQLALVETLASGK